MPLLFSTAWFQSELAIFGPVPFPVEITHWTEKQDKTIAGHIADSRKAPFFVSSPEYFERTWFIRGERIDLYGIKSQGWYVDIECPRLFGSNPVVAQVKDRHGKWEPYSIRLPASGVAEPKLPIFKANVGGVKLMFKPRPWLSPYFPLRYEVSVSGKQSVLLDFDWASNEIRPAHGLLVQPGKPGLLRLRDWNVDEELYIQAKILSAKPATLTAKVNPTKHGKVVNLCDTKGKNWGSVDFEQDNWFCNGEWDGPYLTVNRIPIGRPDTVADNTITGWEEPLEFMRGYKTGRRVRASLLSVVRKAETTISLHLPDRKVFGGPWDGVFMVDVESFGPKRRAVPLGPLQEAPPNSPPRLDARPSRQTPTR